MTKLRAGLQAPALSRYYMPLFELAYQHRSVVGNVTFNCAQRGQVDFAQPLGWQRPGQ